ncbi:MAG: S8 family peptidase [Chloroflexia bacterium]
MRALPRLFLALALFLLLLTNTFRVEVDAAPPAAPGTGDLWSYPHVPGELLVGFRSAQPFGAGGTFSAAFDSYLKSHSVLNSSTAFGDLKTFRFRFSSDDDLVARRDDLLRDPRVAFVEPNYIISIQSTEVGLVGPTGPLKPNDERYDQQWAPTKIGADVTWNTLTTGGPILVAVLDTGASPTHPELKERLKQGRGFVNDDPSTVDDNGHGTFTAGLIAATGNNSIGIAGMSWGALVMPIKILDKEGLGTVANFSQGILYAVEQGAQIINVSAGVSAPSQSMEAAVSYAIGKGAIVVAASGNKADGLANYPAAYANVIAVSASTRDDKIAEFSSYGSYVWLAAPGKEIFGTYYRDGDTYAQLNGTSASAPFVTGTIALMLSQRGNLTPKAVREILKATAVDIEEGGFDPHAGYGRLDTFHAVILASTFTPTLTDVSVTPTEPKNAESVILSVKGFDPGEPVTIWLVGEDGSYRYFSSLRSPQAYANQTGELRFIIGPTEPLSVGKQVVMAYGEKSQRAATTTFTVKQAVNTKAFERVPPPLATSDSLAYFTQTGHTLANSFLRYWQKHGGLEIFGFPISEEFTEISPIDGKPYMVQYFERNRFEYHPENAGTEYEVLLGLLGNDVTKGRKFDPVLIPFQNTDTRAYFPETKHTLSQPFLKYWRDNGGLAVFGYPISEPMQEVSPTDGKTYLVQYFERNRFEYHPEYTGTKYEVLLGLLGIQIAKAQGNIK